MTLARDLALQGELATLYLETFSRLEAPLEKVHAVQSSIRHQSDGHFEGIVDSNPSRPSGGEVLLPVRVPSHS